MNTTRRPGVVSGFRAGLALLLLLPTWAPAGTLTLRWEDPRNHPADVLRYRIEWSQDGGATWLWRGRTVGDEKVWVDTAVPGGLVCYRVKAVSIADYYGPPSQPVCVRPPVAPSGVSVTVGE